MPCARRCASCSQLPPPAALATSCPHCWAGLLVGQRACWGLLGALPPPPSTFAHPLPTWCPSLPCLQSLAATDGEEHPQQHGEPSAVQQARPPRPTTAAASGGSSKAASTRVRRLSLPGEPKAAGTSGSGQAASQAPAASATGSSAGGASVAAASSASSSASGPAAPPAALSAQPELPEAHPLPQRRVRFDDSPVKTHKLPEEEAEEEAEAAATPHAQPHLAPIRTAAEPAPALSVAQPPLQQPAPQRARSPSKAIFNAALAARNGLPTLAAAAAAASGSPRKSAAALAVPMSDLIHSVASLSRAGKEPTHRKTNQVGPGDGAREVAKGAAPVARHLETAGVHGGCCTRQENDGQMSSSPFIRPQPQAKAAHKQATVRVQVTPAQHTSLPAICPAPQDSCCAFSQYCRPTQALLAALDGHGPQGHVVSGFLKDRLPQALAEALGEGAAACAAAGGGGDGAGGNPANASFSSTARSSTGGQQQRGSPSKAAGRMPRRSSSSSSGGGGAADAPSVATALASTFLRLDTDLRREMGANANYSGSTAAVCMLQVRGRARRFAGCWRELPGTAWVQAQTYNWWLILID